MEIKSYLNYDRKLIWILRLFFISSVFFLVLVDYQNIFIRKKYANWAQFLLSVPPLLPPRWATRMVSRPLPSVLGDHGVGVSGARPRARRHLTVSRDHPRPPVSGRDGPRPPLLRRPRPRPYCGLFWGLAHFDLNLFAGLIFVTFWGGFALSEG